MLFADKDLLKISASQWDDFKVIGKTIKYNQLIPNGKINVSRTLSSVQIGNSLDPYITIINPIVGHKVYARIVTSNNRVRVGWYQGLNSGFDFVTGEAITSSSATPTATEGVYEITQDMVHAGTNYLQLYFFNCSGATPDTYNITIQLFDLTEAGFDDIAPLRKSVLNFGTGIINATSPLTFSGKTIKYNQLVQNGNFESSSGWATYGGTLSVDNNIGKITITAKAGSNRFQQNIYPIVNNKYLVLADLKCNKNTVVYIHFGDNFVSYTKNVGSTKSTFDWFVQPSQETEPLRFYVNYGGNYLDNGDYVELSNVILIDLTDLFGAGNEPATIDEFYATDLGKLVKAGVYLPYSTTNAEYETIKPITLTRTGRVDLGTLNWAYDSGIPRFRARNTPSDMKLTSSDAQLPNCLCPRYKTTTVRNGQGVNGCLSVSSSWLQITDTNFTNATDFTNAMSGVYLEYETTEPMVLRGIDNVADDYQNCSGKVNRKLGEVDLGTLSWNYFNDNGHSYFFIGRNTPPLPTNYKISSNGINILCSKYKTVSKAGINPNYSQKVLVDYDTYHNQHLAMLNDDYTNATDFTNAMSGVKLIYELATPTVEQHGTIMLSKAITKVEDSAKIELEIIRR